jgi:hypothetical protein
LIDMILVLNPGESLTAVMSGAADTTNPTSLVSWRDNGGTNTPAGSLNGSTAVTLVAAPGDGQRLVDRVQIYNGDTAAVTVALSKVTSSGNTTILSRQLSAGATLRYTADGIEVDTPDVPTNVGTPTANVTASEQGNGLIQKTVLTLSDLSVTVGNTTGVSFGGSKIYDFPAGRILVHGVVASNISFDLTDEGNATPIEATHGGDIAIGTTPPSDGTLTNADVDLLPSTSIDPISAGVAGAALAASAQFDGTGTAKDAFFNVLIDDADVGNGASDVILVSGTVTITWTYLGNY